MQIAPQQISSSFGSDLYRAIADPLASCAATILTFATNIRSYTPLFWSSMGLLTAYNLLDRGLGNLLCLETLVHGTGPQNYFKILYQGANPKCGGNNQGASQAAALESKDRKELVKNSKGYFHVFKDSDLDLADYISCSSQARTHCGESASLMFPANRLNFLKPIFSFIAQLTIPNLKFRFKPEHILRYTTEGSLIEPPYWASRSIRALGNNKDVEEKRLGHPFELDPHYEAMAFKTKKAIPFYHIGFLGTLSQGIDSKTLERMKANPKKVALGALQITCSILSFSFGYGLIKFPLSSFDLAKSVPHSFAAAATVVSLVSNIFFGVSALYFNAN